MKFVGPIVLVVSCTLASSLSAAARDPVFQLDDLQKLVNLSDPQIAPDGKQIAVVVSRPDWKTDKNLQDIELVDVTSGEARAITWKRTDIAAPRWSPDSGRLAFLAHDEETKQAQIFVLSMRGAAISPSTGWSLSAGARMANSSPS
jgi:dipeptidyl aminopeptidase/acylaminoacyl peptidase